MKKILSVIFMMTMFAGMASAKTCTYNCVQPYDLSSGASRFMSTVTGSNFLAKQVAKVILKKELKKNMDGKFKVSVDSYSVKDLKKGIFKTISIKGTDVNAEGVYVSEFNVHTLCNFNYIAMTDSNDPIFKEDLPMAFQFVLTEDNLNKTMESSDYRKVLDDLNRLGGNLGLFKVNSSKIKIKDNKFYYVLKIAIPFVKNTQEVVLMSDLKAVNGEVDFTNTKLMNSRVSIDLGKIDRIINYLNPLDFSLNILENKDAEVMVQNIKIKDNRIIVDGFFVIPKDEG